MVRCKIYKFCISIIHHKSCCDVVVVPALVCWQCRQAHLLELKAHPGCAFSVRMILCVFVCVVCVCNRVRDITPGLLLWWAHRPRGFCRLIFGKTGVVIIQNRHSHSHRHTCIRAQTSQSMLAYRAWYRLCQQDLQRRLVWQKWPHPWSGSPNPNSSDINDAICQMYLARKL